MPLLPRYFFAGLFLSLIFFAGQPVSATGSSTAKGAPRLVKVPRYKAELQRKIGTALNQASAALTAASNYACYWGINLISTKCLKNLSLCHKLVKDESLYTDSQYQMDLYAVRQTIEDARNVTSSNINASTVDSPDLQKRVDHYVNILLTRVPEQLEAIHTKVKKLQEDYKTLFGTTVCPKA